LRIQQQDILCLLGRSRVILLIEERVGIMEELADGLVTIGTINSFMQSPDVIVRFSLALKFSQPLTRGFKLALRECVLRQLDVGCDALRQPLAPESLVLAAAGEGAILVGGRGPLRQW
jgi:hypothetical protein